MRYDHAITHPDGTVTYGLLFNHEWHRGWEAPPAGHIYSEDLITGEVSVVAESQVSDFDYGTPEHKAMRAYMDAAYDEAKAKSDALGNQLKAGKLFSVGVGDGRAFYVVTKVNPKTCDIAWRGFCPDRYTDQVLGWGGRMPRERIERLVVRQDAIDSVFGTSSRKLRG
jgi:hypothetical protein